MKLIKALLLAATLAASTSAFAFDSSESIAYTDALQQGDLALVKKVLDSGVIGVDEKREFFGWTSLQIAANKGQLAVVKELIARKANLNYQHEMTKNTAFHLAAMSGHKEVVKALAEAGADINLKLRAGVGIIRVVRDMGNTEMVDLLLSLGVRDEGCEGECF